MISKIVFCIACVLNREHVCSQTCSPQNMVFTTPLTKRVDFAFFIIVFSLFSRTKNNKKNSFYDSPDEKRRFRCRNNKKKTTNISTNIPNVDFPKFRIRNLRAPPHLTACILYSVICFRGNGVIRRTRKVIQGDDNGHVGRPC
jgi:hypothetical protein